MQKRVCIEIPTCNHRIYLPRRTDCHIQTIHDICYICRWQRNLCLWCRADKYNHMTKSTNNSKRAANDIRETGISVHSRMHIALLKIGVGTGCKTGGLCSRRSSSLTILLELCKSGLTLLFPFSAGRASRLHPRPPLDWWKYAMVVTCVAVSLPIIFNSISCLLYTSPSPRD